MGWSTEPGTSTGRIVALKVLEGAVRATILPWPFPAGNAGGRSQNHPNVVRRTMREVSGTWFLVMEYVEGVNLSQLVKQCGPLGIADACQLVRQAAIGLQHAFQHGLVHRDIKPSNLLLTREGEVKVLDLGLALLRDAPESKEEDAKTAPGGSDASAATLATDREATADELTGTGIMGTCDYMAPEQTRGAHEVDIRADIYSLGCTLYRLLADRALFEGPEYNIRKEIAAPPCRAPSCRMSPRRRKGWP